MEAFKVELFASFAELFGDSHLEIPLPRGSTVADLSGAILQLPEAGSLPRKLVVAVNQAYVSPETVISPTDEIALIPPVAGG